MVLAKSFLKLKTLKWSLSEVRFLKILSESSAVWQTKEHLMTSFIFMILDLTSSGEFVCVSVIYSLSFTWDRSMVLTGATVRRSPLDLSGLPRAVMYFSNLGRNLPHFVMHSSRRARS